MSENLLSVIDNPKRKRSLASIPEGFKLDYLMNSEFIRECSDFSSLQELIDLSPFKTDTTEDFFAIPDRDWDVFINENTHYENWLEMQKAAAVERTKVAMLKGL